MSIAALHRWQGAIQPRSKWRRRARAAMARVVETYLNTHSDLDAKMLTYLVDCAYPFGPRSHTPYKAWLEERTMLREHMAAEDGPTAPSDEELAVLAVARDLVEEGRPDVAQALVDEQAPNRHNKNCPTCKALSGEPCWDFDAPIALGQAIPYAVVPHHARLDIRDPIPGETDFSPLTLTPASEG